MPCFIKLSNGSYWPLKLQKIDQFETSKLDSWLYAEIVFPVLIGKRLKGIRKQKKLSLRALAEVSGVTVGALSQIENDNSSPSVSTLKRILNPLGISLGSFFDEIEVEHQGSPYVFRGDELRNISPNGGIEILAMPDGLGEGEQSRRQLELLVEHYSPGGDTGNEFYAHVGEECGICLEGSIEITVDGHTTTLEPGDTYYFDSTLPHRFRNVGTEPAKIVSACSPPTF